ncbi:hypothetical protein BDP27DRAFT_1304273 [Rhodocollybia butyracea]|uniref:Uncharacterized protein n=1 Tax=Rhodocollybia butyracea TaxID=206335 RepID=A0A9P5P6C5_9AGAR|nr:hypothetical protein BDP27DRAFT_1304273 [Rhodocollybia butyracea]
MNSKLNIPFVGSGEKPKQEIVCSLLLTSTPHDHAPGWNKHFALISEVCVKVRTLSLHFHDHQHINTGNLKYVHTRHHADPESSSNLGVEPTEAVYSRDEVGGPLRNAQAGEKLVEEEETVARSTKVYSNSALLPATYYTL